MKHIHLRGIILLGTVVLICLLAIQLYWLNRAFNVAERQFDHSVQMALRRVAGSVASEPEIKRLSSRFFFVVVNAALDDSMVDALVRKEFLLRDLAGNYELGIYNAADDTLVYGHYVKATRNAIIDEPAGSVKSVAAKNFAIYFPEKASYLAAEMDIWIFSTVVLLCMTGFFAYAMASLLREKRFSDLKNDFINNMTHELKTPVTNIRIAAEILNGKAADPQSKAYIDILLRENKKLQQKIEHVLYSAAAEQMKNLSLEVLDVNKLIAECAEAFQMKIRQREGNIKMEFQATNVSIAGDRMLLMQAIGNVIDNAEKYSNGKPNIVVRTQETASEISIDIMDKGIGIPEKMTSKVFDKFFRVPAGDVHNIKGFGLGLNFARNVIRSHRGRITLFSELDKGTDVRIFLPRV